MNIRSIPDSLPGEHLFSVVPKPSPNVDPPWHRRLNLFTGRSLSDLALRAEQRSRAGHLALLGGSLSPGVVSGLPVTVEPNGEVSDFLHIGGGSGITAQGEEIVLSQALRLDIAALCKQSNTNTQVQILLLQPVTVLARSAKRDDGENDDTNIAFEDRQIIDGLVLKLYDWSVNVNIPPALTDASLSRWRNELAYTLFNEELRKNELGQRMPWETPIDQNQTVGLPIALLGLNKTLTRVLFADSYAVVRQGGKPRTRSPLVLNSGNEFIWQARIQQFKEHFIEQFEKTAFQNLDQASISEHFRYLPPVGLLPNNVVNWTTNQHLFFPANYSILARALPLEELDKVVEASASLMPLMLDQPEQVELLVPIPQAFYEPDVLNFKETVNPIFETTRKQLVESQRPEWLGRRNWNRDRLALITKCLTGKSISFEADDTNEVTLPPSPVEPDYNTVVVSNNTLQATLIEQLRIDLRNKTPSDQDAVVANEWTADIPKSLSNKVTFNKESKLLTVTGKLSESERDILSDLSSSLGNKATISNLYTQSQDNNDLERLNPQSPDFIGIVDFVQFLESKVASANDAIDFGFLQVRTDMYRIRQFVLGTDKASILATSPTLAEIATRDNAVATQRDLQKFFEESKKQSTSPTVQSAAADSSSSQSTAPQIILPKSIAANLLSSQSTAPKISESAFLATGSTFKASLTAPIKISQIDTSRDLASLYIDRISPAASAVLQSQLRNTEVNVIDQLPISGLAQRSVSVGDRLSQAPAVQAQSYTIANREATLINIAKVGIFKDILIPGQDLRFGQVRPGIKLPSDKDAIPLTDKSDQFEYISSGVKALDNTVAALRLAEGRVQAYREAIAICNLAIAKLQDTVKQISQRLEVIEGKLTEIRHDLSVIQALKNEEDTRIKTINARRKMILDKHVPFLVFRRPRIANLLVNSPAVYVNPAPTIDPIPACLNAHPAVPDDLRAMIDLLRHAPVGWFVTLPRVVDQLNTLELQYRTFDSAQQLPTLPTINTIATNQGFGRSIGLALQSHRQVLLQKRLEMSYASNLFRPKTWKEGREQANTLLTLGSLIDGNHGLSTVRNQATQLLNQMSQIAACLYDLFNDVPTTIRLGWAQRLSEFDEPINLRSLVNLPRWGELPFLVRRDLQTLADWLYQQIQETEPAAIAFLNDLIRVSILLASHAPVKQIINGNVIKQIPARLDNRVELTVDNTQINVGMTVLLHSSDHEVIAHAIVEDLMKGKATAKITKILKTEIPEIPVNTRAKFLNQLF